MEHLLLGVVKNGVLQDGVLGSLLFILIINGSLDEIKSTYEIFAMIMKFIPKFIFRDLEK